MLGAGGALVADGGSVACGAGVAELVGAGGVAAAAAVAARGGVVLAVAAGGAVAGGAVKTIGSVAAGVAGPAELVGAAAGTGADDLCAGADGDPVGGTVVGANVPAVGRGAETARAAAARTSSRTPKSSTTPATPARERGAGGLPARRAGRGRRELGVVAIARRGIAEHPVRGGDQLEALGGKGFTVDVGMQPLRQVAIGGMDLGHGGIGLDAEQVVVRRQGGPAPIERGHAGMLVARSAWTRIRRRSAPRRAGARGAVGPRPTGRTASRPASP